MSNDSVRVKATGNIQVDNERVRVTEYTFKSGAETAFHRHEWDYVVVPQTDGKLLLVDGEGKETMADLSKGVSYYRKAGVEHNVINAGNQPLLFVEIEMKAYTAT